MDEQDVYPEEEDTRSDRVRLLIRDRVRKIRFYSKHSRKEISRRKCNYCLGFMSCFVVVVIICLIDTTLDKAPIIFLSVAEANRGQTDMIIEPKTEVALNLTAVEDEFTSTTSRTTSSAGVFKLKGKCDGLAPLPADTFNSSAWAYEPPSEFESYCSDNLQSLTGSCMYTRCGSVAPATYQDITFYDHDREKKMGFGRSWPHEKLGPREVIMGRKLARRIEVEEGEVLVLYFTDADFVKWGLFDSYLETMSVDLVRVNPALARVGLVFIPVVIKHIISDTFGKLPEDTDEFILMEGSTFPEVYANFVNPLLRNPPEPVAVTDEPFSRWEHGAVNMWTDEDVKTAQDYVESIRNVNIWDYSDKIYLNLPEPRIDFYMSTTWRDIQRKVVDFTSRAIYKLGFPQVESELPLVRELRKTRFFALYLGMMLDMIIIILFFLSALLIYSLLMINVETRTFELGVLRMIGIQRKELVELLIWQSLMYGVPAWSLGLVVAQIFQVMLSGLFSDMTDIDVSPLLTTGAVLRATMMGLGIPAIASLVPITKALTMNINDCLDIQHAKIQAVKFDIKRSEDTSLSWPLIIVGSALAIFGFVVYYVIPLSLVAENLKLLFTIMFLLLLGLLLGLILLSLNFERILERFVGYLTLFWEKRAIRSIVLKNLAAHRSRNQKTTIMYAISLSFIIFITVGFSIQMKSLLYASQRDNGAVLVVKSNSKWQPLDEWTYFENLHNHYPFVKDWAWISHNLYEIVPEMESLSVTNMGHVYDEGVEIYAVSPNFYNVVLDGFLTEGSTRDSGLSLSQQLYTQSGSQGVVMASAMNEHLGAKLGQPLLLNYQMTEYDRPNRTVITPIGFTDASPVFRMTKWSTRKNHMITSLTNLMRWSEGSIVAVSEVPMQRILLRVEGASDAELDEMIEDMNWHISWDSDVYDYRTLVTEISGAETIVGVLFSVTITLAMFLGLFSVTSSMYTNILEQTKEIGILRSIGVSQGAIVRIYCEEAFVLIFASSFLGIIIGTMVGWTMMLQRVVFTQLPIPFAFPWPMVITALVSSFFCALASSFGPAKSLAKANVVSILRPGAGQTLQGVGCCGRKAKLT